MLVMLCYCVLLVCVNCVVFTFFVCDLFCECLFVCFVCSFVLAVYLTCVFDLFACEYAFVFVLLFVSVFYFAIVLCVVSFF